MRSRAPFSGIYWTVAPAAWATFRPPPTSKHEAFRLEIDDPRAGRIALTGALHEPPTPASGQPRGLVVGLHGLGGSIDSSYLRRFAAAATGAGFAFLRLNHRGADRSGTDFYHAGLASDLDAVLRSPALARFERRAVVGFSLGGHVALRWAAERGAGAASAVQAVASVCSPLDLELGAQALDAPGAWLYRRWVIPGLNAQVDAVERRAPDNRGARLVAVERERRLAAKTIRAWDGLVIAPRWDFASAEDYYARASVAPILGRIEIPAWIVASKSDPMVPPWTLARALESRSPSTDVTWTARGGHVGMPAGLDLGRAGERGLAAQLLSWIGERLAG